VSLVSDNSNHDVCFFVGVRRTSISLLISAGLSHEAVAALSNKAPGSLKDYVEPSIHDKEAKQHILGAALLGMQLIVLLSRYNNFFLGFRPDKKTPSEATLQYFDEVHAKTPPPSPPPERPDSPLQNCTLITDLPSAMQDWILERYPNIREKLGIASVSSNVSTHPTQTPTPAPQPIITTNLAQSHVIATEPNNTTNTPNVVTQSSDITPLQSTPSAPHHSTPSITIPSTRKELFPTKAPTDAEIETALTLFLDTLEDAEHGAQTPSRLVS
jgi:hypothetical protein